MKNSISDKIRAYGTTTKCEQPIRVNLCGTWLGTKTTTIIYGGEKSGKSWFALLLALGVSTGISVFDYIVPVPEAKKVLLVTTELDRNDVEKRIDCLCNSSYFANVKPNIDICEWLDFDAEGKERQDEFTRACFDAMYNLVIIDNIYTTPNATSPKFWGAIKELCGKLKELGIPTVLIANVNKKGELYGSKNVSYFADNIIYAQEVMLKSEFQQYICFAINIEKSRACERIDTLPRFAFIGSHTNYTVVTFESQTDFFGDVVMKSQMVLEAVYGGKSRVMEIAEYVGISHGYACKLLAILVNKGYVIREGHRYYPPFGPRPKTNSTPKPKSDRDGINGPIIDL